MENKLFTCAEARKIDLVEYLFWIGFKPAKIRNNDYWYLSHLREEKEASFKVNRKLKVWYDFGIGKGGDLIDFATLYHNCTISELLERLRENYVSFQPHQYSISKLSKNIFNNSINAGEKKIKIIDVTNISNVSFCRYLQRRRIPLDIANLYCKEVSFQLNDKKYFALGFENNAGGYELRNQFFKGSSSPIDVTSIEKNIVDAVTVFEGFFSFLSYQVIHKDQEGILTNFLILNSLSLFEKSRPLPEKYSSIHLYLDRDKARLKQTKEALKMNQHYKDESAIYKSYKDMNDWLTGKRMIKEQRLHQGKGL